MARCLREFDGGLRKLVTWRDGTCRAPGCDSPVRHVDHVERARDGGETSARNGVGVREAHNYAHEAPGHDAWILDEGGGPPDAPTVLYRFPTGHLYTSPAPPLLPTVRGPVRSRPPG